MEKLQEYFDNEYLKEKEQQKSVEELIKKVLPIYSCWSTDFCWPYEFDGNCENGNSTLSISTTAMLAFSMSVLFGKNTELVIDDLGHNYFEDLFEKDMCTKYKDILNKTVKKIESEFLDKGIFTSKTFGNNDPFSLMWIRYLEDNLTDLIEDKSSVHENFLKSFNNLCEKNVKNILNNIYSNKASVTFSESENGSKSPIENTHIFPLLKIVQLHCMNNIRKNSSDIPEKKCDKKEYVIEAKNILATKEVLHNSLHYYLSLTNIEYSNFDTAELVFSLEGLLLLDENKDNFDQNLLKRVFDVVKEKQEVSLYWRPLKPFVSNQQGLALLPLSVEIAMSLIRICRMLGKRGEKLFSQYVEIFEKYTEWVKTRVVIISCDGNFDSCAYKSNFLCGQRTNCETNKFYGWCSEHAHKPNVIHLWETSQVLVYLANYNEMLQNNIAYKSLKFANLTSNNYGFEIGSWEKWALQEPISKHGFRIYENIGKNYVDIHSNKKKYSMLLYGPPGTGKSSIAEEIAKAKGWPLITITPSDFIASGIDQVENKTKNIFKVLEEQKEIVVLFDEIDRLILDRDSGYYFKQSDLFQFMTPSMLVKLKNLRVKEKIIFIIATNYEERIDLAIKRSGRIDEKYLVLPPDKIRRQNILKKKFGNLLESFEDLIVQKTALYTFTEFKNLLDKIEEENSNGSFTEEKIINLIKTPSITLMSYSGKIGNISNSDEIGKNAEENPQKPTREFLALLYLRAEVCTGKEKFKAEEMEVINKYLFTQYSMNNDIDFYELLKDELSDLSMVQRILEVLKELIDSKILNNETSKITTKIDEALAKIKVI
ncbi:ATP-binding protein [Acetobacterium wieringae]|uniref:ATP-binding protein n=1 Tax=Acetobacterium wieringae TaxID=52694 RepID=UPI003159798B